LALDYLPGSITFDPVAEKPDAELASTIVWFDAFVTTSTGQPRNANMLIVPRRLWLIDHGAALYFHHSWSTIVNAVAILSDESRITSSCLQQISWSSRQENE